MAELWQQCAEWLRECIQLDKSIKFNRLEEFAAFLKNGFALCALANRLSDGCVSQVRNYNTGTSQFISESNLSLFLNACRDTFGIVEKDLFNVEDLSYLIDFSKVLKVLSLLSRSRHAEVLGISPFPRGISRRTSHYSLEVPDDEAEIYIELRSKPAVDEAATKFGTNFGIYESDHNEEIYNTFVYQPMGKTKYADFKPKSKREHCMKELLDTEMNYCDTLRMIIEKFYTPLDVILDATRMKRIFINIVDLSKLHTRFLDRLRKAILISFGLSKADENEQPMNVPEIFISFKRDFLKYSEYCAFMEGSREEITLIEKEHPDINKRIEEYRAKAGQQNVKLGDILTVPMQRILKYHLLLKQLLDTTSPGDPEIQLWDSSYEGMKDVSDYVNEGKRDHELFGVVRHFQRENPSFPQGEEFMQWGRVLQDGQLKLIDSSTGSKVKSRYAFLFEKTLLIFKNKNGGFCSSHAVANFKIVEPEHESQLNRGSSTLSRKLTISLFDHTSLMVMIKDPNAALVGDPSPYLEFIFSSTEKRNMWRKMLETAIDRNVPATAKRLRHKVVYHSYSSPTECSVCNKLLLGMFFQGYHCQTCNKNMHYACLDLGQTICRQPTLTSLINRSNSNGSTHILMQPHRFESGDKVQAIKAVNSQDSSVLNFQEGDVIEILRESEDGLINGRLFNQPTKVGILSRDSVKKISRSHSLAGSNSPQQSPMRTIDPNVSRLSVSVMPEHLDRRPSLASSEIITRYENIMGMTTEMYPWYFGELERNDAKVQLGNNPDGTFLVRKSKNQSQYVLSVLYKGTDKHILIELDQESRLYWIHGARYFHDIPALIKYYRNQGLDEGFTDLFTQLKGTPLRQTLFRAVHSFNTPPSDTTNYLRLDREDTVRVLDTNGEENGWWKGISKGVLGFFPLAYVEEVNGGVEVQIRGETPSTEVY